MIMRAKQDKNVIIVELEGHLDFETTIQLKDTCAGLMKRNGTGRIVFNMERLKFVGSSGINQFIQVLKSFNTLNEKPRYCRLSVEFQKIFKAFQTTRNPFEVFEDESTAIVSFDLPPVPKKAPRKTKTIDV